MKKLEVVAVRDSIGPGDVWLGMLWVGYAWRVVPLGGGMRLFPLVGTHLNFIGLWRRWGVISSSRAPAQKGPAFTV